jgi:type II secretory pathway pseudopilin PulG
MTNKENVVKRVKSTGRNQHGGTAALRISNGFGAAEPGCVQRTAKERWSSPYGSDSLELIKCASVTEELPWGKGKHMHRISKHRCQGITLIEILLILGFLVIISSFAATTMSGATARADMRVASENLQYSIRIARNTARMTESKVTMNISEDVAGQVQRITFSVSGAGLKALGQPGLQEDRLPEDIRLVSDYRSYEFDGRGIVQNPGVITLVSKTDKSLITRLKVE